MRRTHRVVTLAFVLLYPTAALADDPYALAAADPGPLPTWGNTRAIYDPTVAKPDPPVTRARELLTRSRLLDDAASREEKSATELAASLPSLRAAARIAREHADRAAAEDKEALGARADDLETDVIVSEAEVAFKRKTAADNRRVAHDLRLRAVKLVREAPISVEPTAISCDPPFRFTPDGRKIYRIECLK